jgi:hypothetical protein
LNIEASARTLLPISPGNQNIAESSLLSYYQGRISWEELFPDPDLISGLNKESPLPVAPESGVDKSRIQSYQIREFVEALTGLRKDLEAATQTEPSMRLALLGPVSPVALVQTIVDAVKKGRRTPMAASFQLVEILACLRSAYAFPVPGKLSMEWKKHLREATKRTNRGLRQLLSEHRVVLVSNKAFNRYHKAVLASGPRPKS